MTTAKEAPVRGLHAKLVEVMAAITHIEKGGRNEVQKYDFVRQADVAHAVRTALAERKVTCVPTTIDVVESRDYESKSGGRQHFLLVRVDWTFTDAESGETLVVSSLGAGTDANDKAPYKAMTGASKYAELLTFLIPTGDDPEKDTPAGSERASKPSGESVELIGIDTVTGVVAKGGADKYQAEWRETPSGHVIGFTLKRKDDKDFPQVGVMGDIGETLYLSKTELLGQKVTLKGRFYAVRQSGRTGYTRIIVGQGPGDYIETDDWRIPPATEANPEGVSPLRDSEPVPGQVEAFDAKLSAELDAEEVAAR